MEVSPLTLLRALRLNERQIPGLPGVALVGGGGKSTALFQLARELVEETGSALVTATTHLAPEQAQGADRHIILDTPEAALTCLEGDLPGGITLFTGPPERDAVSGLERLSGLKPALIQRMAVCAQGRGLRLLVEADGSRRLPLKAPAEHEPAIPTCAGVVVVCAGLLGIGRRLEASAVHRPERFAALSGLHLGAPVTADALRKVLVHPQGGLKGILHGRQALLLLNQADTPGLEAAADAIAREALGPYQAVVTAALERGGVRQVNEAAAGIVLAAGAAQRFGRPKQLLEVGGKPLVRTAAETALAAGLNPVVVVSGAYAGAVAEVVQGLPVRLVHNPAWEEGQGSSVRVGVESLPDQAGSAAFLLADQPFVTAELLRALVQRHARTLSGIVAPRVVGQRTNPVLFDRDTFADLRALHGDTGGRAVLNTGRYAIEWLEWEDERLLEDIDTEEDYRRLVGGAE